MARGDGVDGQLVVLDEDVAVPHDPAVLLEHAQPLRTQLLVAQPRADLLGDTMFDWAEGEARRAGVARVRAFFPAGHELAAVVQARGYPLWRSSFTMETELTDDPPADSPLPNGLVLRTFREGVDEDTVRAAVNEAFSADPFFRAVSEAGFREFYVRARGFHQSLWLLAWDGGELAGVSLAYAERVGEPGLGWIGTLGVRERWRRRGLGEALLRHSFRSLHECGLRRVGLGVDAENATGALRLYERAGMRIVRQGDNWTLDLRPQPKVG